MEPHLARRIQFLVDEARAESGRRDNATTSVHRSISNYLTVGRDGDSATVKRHNTWMSAAAFKLALGATGFADWHKQTVNEHEEELRGVWAWMINHRETLSAATVYQRLQRPFVTVTKEENDRLRRLRKASFYDKPEARYDEVGIAVGHAKIVWVGKRPGRLERAWQAR